MPTTFIILPDKLPSPATKKEKDQLLEVQADDTDVKLSADLVSVSCTADGPKIGPGSKLQKDVKALETGITWINCIKDIRTNLLDGNIETAFDIFKAGLADLMVAERIYVYLVDELTGEPVRASGWPIKIEKQSEHVHKLLPAMQIGLRSMSIYNGTSGIAQMSGFPIRKVPELWSKGAR